MFSCVVNVMGSSTVPLATMRPPLRTTSATAASSPDARSFACTTVPGSMVNVTPLGTYVTQFNLYTFSFRHTASDEPRTPHTGTIFCCCSAAAATGASVAAARTSESTAAAAVEVGKRRRGHRRMRVVVVVVVVIIVLLGVGSERGRAREVTATRT